MAVGVQIVDGEVHRAVYGWKARQNAPRCCKLSLAIVLEEHDALVGLGKQRDDVGCAIAREVAHLEVDCAGARVEDLPGVVVASLLVEREAAAVIPEFADEELLEAVAVDIDRRDGHRTNQRIDDDSSRAKRVGEVVLLERASWLVVRIEDPGFEHEDARTLDDEAGGRATELQRGKETAIPVEDRHGVRP